jgi:uncharacterized protein (TIGR00369 family)
MHGGLTASLIDAVSTAALFNTKIRKPGVTTNLSVNYIRPAKINQKILIEGKVVNLGSKLAFLTANIYVSSSNTDEDVLKIIASGTHTKYIL